MTTALTPRLALLMTIPPLLWAGNVVVGRLAVGQIPPLALNAMRWSLALAILLPLGWRAVATPAARAEIRARWRPLAVLGGLGVGYYNAMQYVALKTSTPLNITLIASSLPVWMLAVGALFHGERAGRRAVAGAALSLAGVVVVLARGDVANLAQIRFVAGDLMMVVAIIGWAFYSWMLARPHPSLAGARRPDWDWAGFLLVQTLFGVAWGWAFAGAEALVDPAPIRWSPWVAVAIAYVAVGPSVIAYRCWGLGVTHAGPAAAAFFGNLTPLFAALLSAAVLGEPARGYHALAFVLIVAGIVVSSRR